MKKLYKYTYDVVALNIVIEMSYYWEKMEFWNLIFNISINTIKTARCMDAKYSC